MSFPDLLEPGILIGGHYIVVALINRGGFGAVYRGIDTSEGDRSCAIKETYDVTPAARRHALMEAGILFTVKSKHLPQVYDAFEANGRFYLVMQLIEGQNLQQLLAQRGAPCSEQEVLAWLAPVMRVLQELHSRTPAILHRDIKPANIILTPAGTAVLVDFGLTKLYEPGSHTQTRVRAISEGFSPLEQYLGNTSPQSDMYSLAATMYFLLTNVVPPAGLKRSLHDELQPPRVLNRAITPRMERVLLKALAVEPGQRYANMREFADALQEPGFSAFADPTIRGRSVPASPPPSAQPLPDPRAYAPAPYPLPPSYQAPVNVSYLPAPPRQTSYGMAPQASAAPPLPHTLPSPFGQGCLWGLVQGALAAIMLLLLKNAAYIYVAMLIGFLAYFWAGFRTTRRGGRSFRGGWAGLWAGITSTLIFWVVLVLGLIILVSQRIQADAQKGLNARHPDQAFNHALHVVLPFTAQPGPPLTSTGVLTFLSIGLVLAVAFGWIGGMVGKARYKKKRGYP
ncbi:MAG: serine/threonine protein kinase [Ktedonobacteraceae bacterium]|nr:serine/threonine protein kinase [Ktedonobacteraceae bacterium]